MCLTCYTSSSFTSLLLTGVDLSSELLRPISLFDLDFDLLLIEYLLALGLTSSKSEPELLAHERRSSSSANLLNNKNNLTVEKTKHFVEMANEIWISGKFCFNVSNHLRPLKQKAYARFPSAMLHPANPVTRANLNILENQTFTFNRKRNLNV